MTGSPHMHSTWDLLVRRASFAEAEVRTVSRSSVPLDTSLTLRIDGYTLTANNMTYAQLGDQLGYWDLFPTVEGWGRLPAWGWATVGSSMVDGVAPGDRYVGLVPMSTRFGADGVLCRGGFRDDAVHRRHLNPVYNRYAHTQADGDELAYDTALRPVFLLSFVLAEHLRRNNWYGARRVLITSASSKAALGLVHLIDDVWVIGLTSASNRAFVASVGMFDDVVTYDDIADLPAGDPTLLVDIAGNSTVTDAIVGRLGERLVNTVLAGRTHTSAPHNTIVSFFAPVAIQDLVTRWGRTEYETRLDTAIQSFIDATRHWMRLDVHVGAGGALEAYRRLERGQVDPRTLIVVHPSS